MSRQTEDSSVPINTRTPLYLRDFPERLGKSSVTIWRARDKKKFPEPTCWLRETPGWAVERIERWERGYASELIAAYEASKPRDAHAQTRTVLWLRDLPERLGKSSVTIWRARREKKFVEPTLWLDKAPGWAIQVIELWELGCASELAAAYEASKLNEAQTQGEPQRRKRRMTQTDWVPTTQ